MAELERRRAAAPLLFFQKLLAEHPKQREFLGSEKRVRLFLGGNRSGKTTAGRHLALAHAYGYRYWDVPGLRLTNTGDLPPREEISPRYWIRRSDGTPVRVPNVGMVLSGLPRQRGIGQNIFPGLYAELPQQVRAGRGGLHVLKGAQGVPEYMDFPNGSRIMFASEEQDDMSFEGFTLDWCWVDEPIRQSLFSAVWARLHDFQGSIWFTLTPLGGKAAWLHELMILGERKDAAVITVAMGDNPANTPEKIQSFIAGGEFTESELRSRLKGEFEHLSDRVFALFNPTVHVCKGFLPPENWIHVQVTDPHHARPAATVWFALNPESGTYHFYREWPDEPVSRQRGGALPPAEYASLLRNVEGRRVPRYRVCDPRFGKAEYTVNGYTNTCFAEMMAQYGINYDTNVPNTARIEYGHEVINDLLRYDTKFPVGPTNHPKLYIHEGCEQLIRSMLNYTYTNTKDPHKEMFTKVSEEWKDFIDCVRYGVLWPIPATEAQRERMQTFTAADLKEHNEVL